MVALRTRQIAAFLEKYLCSTVLGIVRLNKNAQVLSLEGPPEPPPGKARGRSSSGQLQVGGSGRKPTVIEKMIAGKNFTWMKIKNFQMFIIL